jgi:thiosulfate dehydrogenase
MLDEKDTSKLVKSINSLLILLVGVIIVMVALVVYITVKPDANSISEEALAEQLKKDEAATEVVVKLDPLDTSTDLWQAPSDAQIPYGKEGEELHYGRELVAHTAEYFGPNGSIKHLTNGLNCQNCHLDAGTKPWGNNYGSVASTYPKMRGRSGQVEGVYKRIADCFERSLNGVAPDSNSREMKAMKAYIVWLGKDVTKGEKAKGSGIYNLAFLDRPLNPENGKKVYEAKCQSCHQADGQGLPNADKTAYMYPPLWGDLSYNQGAGLFRMSRFAGYVKANMPLGASYSNPMLTDEESWDVAAFVNTQRRPAKDLSKDWPDISKKNFDHPFGPYSDPFSEEQHKFGPYKPIKEFYAEEKNK